MFLVETEFEISQLRSGILVFGGVSEGGGLENPFEVNVGVDVVDFLIFVDGDGQILLFWRLVHFDPVRGAGDFGGEVDVGGFEHPVGGETVEFVHHDGELRREFGGELRER